MIEIGSKYLGNKKCEFVIWAPLLTRLTLHITTPQTQLIPLTKDKMGYWKIVVDDIEPGARYTYQLNETNKHPDPASHFQPEDVFGASQVVDHQSFSWSDSSWQNIALKEYIIYELHIGTFTEEGTFDSAIDKISHLKELGVNAVEIMPVAQFPNNRNWGYDGVYPFAVQHSYGGPLALKTFVDACHRQGLAVILDVVYNHLGPEGNFLPQFMPIFTDKYSTPWGKAINFDDADSHGVRNYFMQNALYWFKHYHIDALRLDAIHGIFDNSDVHILKELAECVENYCKLKNRQHYLIAESDLNDSRIVLPKDKGGYAIHAQWSDDFHHALHTLLTKESRGYYEDFGQISHLAKAIKETFVYNGNYSNFRKKLHGNSADEIKAEQIVVCAQNHDQIGNRLAGERLSQLISFEALKLAACSLIFSPYIPLLFMGEEYGEDSPFQYFMSFHDEKLIKAVREGRKKEFKAFDWKKEPPDPYAQSTFNQSKLKWQKLSHPRNQTLFKLYQHLIRLRKDLPVFHNLDKNDLTVQSNQEEQSLIIKRWHDKQIAVLFLNFNDSSAAIEYNDHKGKCKYLLDSSDKVWDGPGTLIDKVIEFPKEIKLNPLSCAVLIGGKS